MSRTCRASQEPFEVTTEDLTFLKRLSPRIKETVLDLPPPTLSPRERMRRRLSFRNERNLYRRKCEKTGREIISVYSPDKPFPVYAKDVWWSDSWDPRDYGRDFDFSRPFFEQFGDLLRVTPRVALITSPDADEHNCLYINFAGNSRNCYMIFDSDFCEDSLYSNVLKHSRSCLDCSYVSGSELCYDCVDCAGCYRLLYSQDCSNCSDSFFLNGCIGCTNCLFCTNLSHKEYWVENRQRTKEEYAEILRSLQLTKRSAVESHKARSAEIVAAAPRKYARLLRTENCLGDYIRNSKDCALCFNIGEADALRYCDSLYSARNCMDVSSFGEEIDYCYESGTTGINCTNIFFSFVSVLNCADLLYCQDCRMSRNCFGCASMKRAEFCILNKQYSADEYAALVPRIVEHMRRTGEWGEYFPPSLSAFGYNETVANAYFPLSRDEALRRGFHWSGMRNECRCVRRPSCGKKSARCRVRRSGPLIDRGVVSNCSASAPTQIFFQARCG